MRSVALKFVVAMVACGSAAGAWYALFPPGALDPAPAEAVPRGIPVRAPAGASVTLPREPAAVEVGAAEPEDPPSAPATEPAPHTVDASAIARWIRDLADDDVAGNALTAIDALLDTGADAQPALNEALWSYDRQQRQLAAWILRQRDAPPSARLIDVTVEGLQDDGLPYDGSSGRLCPWVKNAKDGLLYLLAHADASRPAVVIALGAADQQQRVLCAYLAGRFGCAEYARQICAELLPHLRDNEIGGDALFAAHGLIGLGGAALSQIVDARNAATGQERELLELLVLDLYHPPTTRRELLERRGRHSVTTLYHDPLIEYDPALSYLGWWAIDR